MARAAANPPRIHCSAEWHLRDNPRAIGIYTLACRITKSGQKGSFYLSQPQVAQYFGWNLKTVRAAFKAVRDSGLFTLLRSGSGGDGHANYANIYDVVTHSKLSKDNHPCRPLPETGTLVYKPKAREQGKTGGGAENGRGAPPETGTLRGLPGTGTLVYDSTIESTSDAAAPGNQSSASPRKFTEYPADFQPDDDNRELAKKLRLNLEESLQAFKDFHQSKANRHVNWHLALNTWLRNDNRWGRAKKPPKMETFDALKAYREQK